MTSLYEIAHTYKALFDEIDFETGEVEETLMERLSKAEEDLNEKLITVGKYIKNLEAEETAVKEEAAKMTMRAKHLANKIERLKSYMAREMEFSNLTKATSSCFNIILRNNPAKLTLKDETQIPYDYKKVKYEWDKTKLKEDLKNGLEVPGATLTNGKSIQFK